MTVNDVKDLFKGATVTRVREVAKDIFGYATNRPDRYLVCNAMNVLTVEDHCKIYNLFYLMEDPDTKRTNMVYLSFGDIINVIDHEYCPDSIVQFCIENDIRIDSISYVCLCKSLIGSTYYDNNNIDNWLPTYEDLSKVITTEYESNSNIFNLYSKYDKDDWKNYCVSKERATMIKLETPYKFLLWPYDKDEYTGAFKLKDEGYLLYGDTQIFDIDPPLLECESDKIAILEGDEVLPFIVCHNWKLELMQTNLRLMGRGGKHKEMVQVKNCIICDDDKTKGLNIDDLIHEYFQVSPYGSDDIINSRDLFNAIAKSILKDN